MRRGSRSGTQRERAVRDWLRQRDWLAFRAPASLGCADVIGLKEGCRPRLIEVKSTAQGPYEHFGPAARERLRFAARLAGADALLAWWPPRGQLRFLPESEWPSTTHTTKAEAGSEPQDAAESTPDEAGELRERS